MIAGTNEIKVSMANMGASPINTATIYFEINNVKDSIVYAPATPLQQYQQDVVSLGNVNLSIGVNTFKVYINLIGDKYPKNDTIFKQRHIGSHLLNGEYIVGKSTTANFKSWADFVDSLKLNGLNGDITLKFESNVYTDSISFINLNTDSMMRNYKLTFTSLANDKDSVIFRWTDTNQIQGMFSLGATSNLEIKNITIDASNKCLRGINMQRRMKVSDIAKVSYTLKDKDGYILVDKS